MTKYFKIILLSNLHESVEKEFVDYYIRVEEYNNIYKNVNENQIYGIDGTKYVNIPEWDKIILSTEIDSFDYKNEKIRYLKLGLNTQQIPFYVIPSESTKITAKDILSLLVERMGLIPNLKMYLVKNDNLFDYSEDSDLDNSVAINYHHKNNIKFYRLICDTVKYCFGDNVTISHSYNLLDDALEFNNGVKIPIKQITDTEIIYVKKEINNVRFNRQFAKMLADFNLTYSLFDDEYWTRRYWKNSTIDVKSESNIGNLRDLVYINETLRKKINVLNSLILEYKGKIDDLENLNENLEAINDSYEIEVKELTELNKILEDENSKLKSEIGNITGQYEEY